MNDANAILEAIEVASKSIKGLMVLQFALIGIWLLVIAVLVCLRTK